MGLDNRLIAMGGNVPNMAEDFINAQAQGMKVGAIRQEQETKNKLAQLMARKPANMPMSAYMNQSGMGDKALEYGKAEADIAKTQADTSKSALEGHLKALDIGARINQGFMAIPEGQLNKQAIIQGAQGYLQQGILKPEHMQIMEQQLASVPDNDQALRQFLDSKIQAGMEAKDRLSLALQKSQQDLTMRGQDITQRGQDLSAQTQMRGQDITSMNNERDYGIAKVRLNRDIQNDEFRNTLDTKEYQMKLSNQKTDKATNNQGAIDSIDTAMESLQSIINHPGREAATGTSAVFNPITVPGTDRAGFNARLETFKAQTFVPMVAQLKGMGALSDAEGKKLTAAVGALDPNMPEKEFLASANDIMQELKIKRERALGNNADRADLKPVNNDDAIMKQYGITADELKAYRAARGK